VDLGADWGSEGVLKDEEALFLDATIYGNVGRFINHRCALTVPNLVLLPYYFMGMIAEMILPLFFSYGRNSIHVDAMMQI
jgi:hypothetical protein